MDVTKGIDALVTRIDLQSFIDTIDYRVARTREELEKAFVLVYQEYLKRNYTDTNTAGLRLSVFNALPETTTFIAVAENEVLATATLIPDSPLGLPMDVLYKQELGSFRSKEKRICEISMLASNTEIFKGGVSMMLNAKKLFFVFFLFKAVFDYVTSVLNYDYICITINPKHYLTYEFLLFKDCGPLKTYEGVKGAPAIAKYLDVRDAEDECKRLHRDGLYKMFFTKRTAPEKFEKKILLSQDDLRFFFLEKTDTLRKASPEQIAHLQTCYPTYDFSQLR